MITTGQLETQGYATIEDYFLQVIQARRDNDSDLMFSYLMDMSKKQRKQLIAYIDAIVDDGEAYGDYGSILASVKSLSFKLL